LCLLSALTGARNPPRIKEAPSESIMAKTLILCDCSGSQTIDGPALSEAANLSCSKVHSALCTAEIGQAAEAIAGGEAIICCRQEQRVFEDLAAEIGAEIPAFTDLRDRAGWSDDPRPKLPKMAALAAEEFGAREEGATELGECERCGSSTTRDVCRKCSLLDAIHAA